MLIKPLDHALMHDIPAVHAVLVARRSPKSLHQRIILESPDVQQHIVRRRSDRQLQCLIVDSGTFREQILAAGVDAIPMEVVRLEELGPELRFGQLGRHVLRMLALNGRIRFENAINDVRREIVLEAVAAVRLRFYVGQKGSGNSYFLLGSLLLGVDFGVSGPEFLARQHLSDHQILVELQQIGILR